jgi:hypothetical protein
MVTTERYDRKKFEIFEVAAKKLENPSSSGRKVAMLGASALRAAFSRCGGGSG